MACFHEAGAPDWIGAENNEETDHEPMGAAVGDGPGAITRVAAGLAGPVATRRLVACSGPLRTSERCLLGDRSDQRPIEVVDACADVRGRIEPLTKPLGEIS